MMNYFSGKSILIVSTEEWAHIPISKHHYSTELTKAGATVYFINPPSDQNKIVQHESNKNLFVIDHRTVRGMNSLPSFLRNILNKWMIKKIKAKTGPIDVVWSFDPYRFQNLNLFGASLKIYHPVDVHNHKNEQEAAQSADLIISVSELILKKFERFKAIKSKITHGLQSQFANPAPIQSTAVKTVGYVGNLDNWCIDIKTLVKIVESNPEITFHFIGPYKKDSVLASLLKKLNNCVLLGRIPSQELPNYFSAVDIFLMVYDGANKDVNSNHHKILEFISTGKPVVMNYTDEYTAKREFVCMSEDNEDLPAIFKSVVNDFRSLIEPGLVSKRIEFAKSNTYAAHVNFISELAKQALQKKQR
jgi:glycosyltransferase involved in cell wall biosynthesis